LDRNSGKKGTDNSLNKKISYKGAANNFYLIYGIILIFVACITYIILQTPEEPIKMMRRFAGTFGFLTIFLAIISSEYMAKMKSILGLPFLKTHHNLARIGILLILIHPLTFALQGRGFNILLPTFNLSNIFISLAGRPALYLFILAAGIALYRAKFKNWRKVHYLNYLAFLLVTTHALAIGADFKLNIMRVFALAMAITVTGIFLHKRLARKSKKS
jgi:DMSO/TMAO reductase YedYZ heme-binding membrane subunit